ncbi:EVE domain-containing protein [Plasmodiophora brassicae]
MSRRYFIGFLTKGDVDRCVRGGYTVFPQRETYTRVRRGDWVVYYSARDVFHYKAQWVRRFTAVGVVTGDMPYPVKDAHDNKEWRSRARFYPDCGRVDARDVVGRLSFIPDANLWQHSLVPKRYGVREVVYEDFLVLAHAMRLPKSAYLRQGDIADPSAGLPNSTRLYPGNPEP